MEDLVVSVGADITGFLSKIDAAKAKVGQLTENQQGLKTVIADLNTSLRLNEKELTNATVKLQKLNTTSKDGQTAAANLRKEIAQLATNSKTLGAQLNVAKTNLATTTTELKAATLNLKKAEVATGGFAGGAQKAFGVLRNLANIIPGLGIGGLVLLISGPVVAAFEAWFESIGKVHDASQLLKKVNEEAAKDVGKEIGNLKILKAVVEDVNAPMALRLQGIKDLKSEFPGLFTGLTNEQILTGNVGKAYDFAAAAIYRKARADAAAQLIQKNAAKDFAIVQKGLEDAAKTNERIRKADKASGDIGSLAGDPRALAQLFKEREAIRHQERLAIQKENDFLINIAKQAPEQFVKLDKPEVERVKKAAKEIVEKIDKVKNAIVSVNATPITVDFSQVTALDPAKLDKAVQDAIAAGKRAAAGIAEKIREAFQAEVAQGLADIASGIGEAIGNALSGRGNVLTNVFESVFDIVGEFLIKLGKATIAGSALVKAISKLATNPAGGIVAGLAAIVAGTVLKNIKLPKFATGGYITGPGSTTSDSIPARLSKGEYVIKASKVAEFGKSFFDMINGGGRPRNGGFADGGSVSGNIGGGQAIQIFGEFELQGTKLVAVVQRAEARIRRNG